MDTAAIYELFAAYTDGSMSQEDLQAFELRLQDADFKAAFDEYCAIENQFIELTKNESKEQDFISNLKKIAKQYPAEGESQIEPIVAQNTTAIEDKDGNKDASKTSFSFIKNIRWALGAAAILLLGVFVYNKMQPEKQSMEQLYASNFVAEPLAVERGIANDSLSKIVQLYSKQQYAEVLPYLEQFTNARAYDGDLSIALAITYLSLKDYEKGEILLKKIIAQNDTYKEKSEWFLALMYLKQNNKEAAVTVLNSFGNSHFYYKKAQGILKALK